MAAVVSGVVSLLLLIAVIAVSILEHDALAMPAALKGALYIAAAAAVVFFATSVFGEFRRFNARSESTAARRRS